MKNSNKISLIALLLVLGVSSCSKMEPLKERNFVQSEVFQDKAMRSVVETAGEDGITDPDHDEDHDKDKVVVRK